MACVAFNSTSRYVMGGSKDGVVSIWDLKTRKIKKSYKVCLDAVSKSAHLSSVHVAEFI